MNRTSLLHDLDRFSSGVDTMPLDRLNLTSQPKLFLLGRQLARVIAFELEPQTATSNPDPKIRRPMLAYDLV